MRFSASSILRISLRSRSRVRSSRLNSSSWVARSFGSGKFAASSFMWETVRSTSTIRSRFQLLRMVRKCSSCSLLMYCSPRLTMYGCTLRGPASRLPGSRPSPSSASAFTGAGGLRGAGGATAVALRAVSFLGASGAASAAAIGRCAAGFLGSTAFLRACVATTRARGASGLRATAFRAGGRLTAFLPFAAFGAGLFAGINDSSKQHGPREERAIIPAHLGLYRCSQTEAKTCPPGRAAPRRGSAGAPGAGPPDGADLGQRDRRGGLPARLSSLGDNAGVDAAAHVEARREPQEARPHGGVQMVGDLVRHGLVKRAAIAERPDVELQ